MFAYNNEVVPYSLEFPHVLRGGLTLHHLGEQCNEEGTTVKAAVHVFILSRVSVGLVEVTYLEMSVEVWD